MTEDEPPRFYRWRQGLRRVVIAADDALQAGWRRLRPGLRPRVLFEAGYPHGLEAERPVIEELLRRGRVAPTVAYSRTRVVGAADLQDLVALGVTVAEANTLRHQRFECVVLTDYPISHGWRARRRTLLHHGSGYAPDGASYAIRLLSEGLYEYLLSLNALEAEAASRLVRSPSNQVLVVGQPKLDRLRVATPTAHARNPAEPPTVLIASHWTPEGLYFNVAESVLGYLATRTDLHVIVSGHPNLWHPELGTSEGRDWRVILAPLIASPHMELVSDPRRTFDLMQQADLLIGDKSSATLEYAALGRPIVHYHHPSVVPQPPEFRRLLFSTVHRFTGAADFVPAFESSLLQIGHPPSAAQQELVTHCFPTLGNATKLAADAIESIAFNGTVR